MAAGSQRTFVERTWIVVGAVALAVLIGSVAWLGSSVLLTLFAGLLLGVLLRGASRRLEARFGLSRTVALTLVCAGIALVIAAVGVFLAASISQQFSELSEQLPAAFEQVRSYVASNPLGSRVLESMTQGGGSGSSQAASQVFLAASTVVAALGNLVLVAFVGLFLAADPGVYRNAVIRLVPVAKRDRAAEVLDDTGEALLRWLVGRIVLMVVIGVQRKIVLLAMGVPLALALGVIAGALSFIPNIGPIISAVPAMLIAAAEAPIMALYVALLYLALQTAESYMLEPYVVRRTSDLPAAAVIGFQLLMGTLAGVLGLTLATPLLVVITVLVGRLYIEDVLGDREGS